MKRGGAHILLHAPLLALLLASAPVRGQLILNQTQAPTTLVQNVLMGAGVFASNVTFNGTPGSIVAPTGIGPSEIGRFNGSNTCLGMNGVFLCTGVANSHLPGPNDDMNPPGGGIVVGGGVPSMSTPDIDLSQLTGWPMWQVSGGGNIHSKAVLEFDFVPMSDMVSVRYVFSSEEYEIWACSEYNDVFGFFLSGPGINGPFTNNAMNIALVPGSMDPVSINSVNSGEQLVNANGPWYSMDPWEHCRDNYPNWLSNVQYYRYNGGQWTGGQGNPGAQLEAPYNADPYYIQHNGMTVTLTASAAVQCGETYRIKLAIGNVNDAAFPSAVWLENGSFTSSDRFMLTADPGPTVEYTAADTIFYENDCDSVHLRFHRLGGFYLDEWLQISVEGDATAGSDYLPALPDSVHFNQLDSFAIVPIAVPVDLDGPEELIVHLITCNGMKVQTYRFVIDQKPPLVVELADQELDCPAEVTLAPVVSGGGGDPAQYEYLWSTGETTSSITHFVDETTQFRVTVKDCWSLEAGDSAWVTLPLYDPLSLSLTPDTAIPCLGHADLEAGAQGGAGGYAYAWTLNGQLQGTDSVLTVPAAVPPVHYVVTVTDLCGTEAVDSVLVSQAPPAPLVLSLPPDTAIACLGHADLIASVSGGGGELTYAWSHGGAVVGTDSVLTVPAADHAVYTVEVSDQCGQTVTGTVEVTTGPTPPLSIVAEGDTVLCAGMEVVLNVISVSGGGGAYSYAWSPAGPGTSSGPSHQVRVDDDTPFTVTVTDECGNSADTTLLAVVQDFPPLTVSVPGDTVVCPGAEVALWAVVSGGAGGYQIDWPGAGTGANISWTAGQHGRHFTVEVRDACGSTATAAVDVSTFPAWASIDATELSEGVWRFEGHVEPPTGNSLSWDFGDGGTATGVQQVTHTYQDFDAYWAVLQVVTADGCLAVDSVRTRPPAGTIYFPNSFTPDGDGFNDSFGGEGLLVTTYRLWVFNRWGQVVFESQDMGHRWDGRSSNGEEVPQGIYQYKYQVEGELMPMRQGFGHINLLR